MIPQPAGWLRRAADIARGHGALLIADEVMTGFGRTGFRSPAFRRFPRPTCRPKAGHQTHFLPRITRACTRIFLPGQGSDRRLPADGGHVDDTKGIRRFPWRIRGSQNFFSRAQFHGNQLGAAAALGSLELLQSGKSIRARQSLEKHLHDELQTLWSLPNVGDIRQTGLIAGIELVRNWRTREPFDLRERAGIRVCEAMARRGVLTRPVGNVIVLMPPDCTTPKQIGKMAGALREAIAGIFSPGAAGKRKAWPLNKVGE